MAVPPVNRIASEPVLAPLAGAPAVVQSTVQPIQLAAASASVGQLITGGTVFQLQLQAASAQRLGAVTRAQPDDIKTAIQSRLGFDAAAPSVFRAPAELTDAQARAGMHINR